jgi:hypothetical protein
MVLVGNIDALEDDTMIRLGGPDGQGTFNAAMESDTLARYCVLEGPLRHRPSVHFRLHEIHSPVTPSSLSFSASRAVYAPLLGDRKPRWFTNTGGAFQITFYYQVLHFR